MPLTGVILDSVDLVQADIFDSIFGGSGMADGNLMREVESGAFWKTALWLGVGVALYMTFQNSIGSLLNPLLASLKLSATPT